MSSEWLRLVICEAGSILIDYGKLRSTIQNCKITPSTILWLGNENKTDLVRGLICTKYRAPSSTDTIHLYSNETWLLIELNPERAFTTCGNAFLEKKHQNYCIYHIPQMYIKHILVLLLSPFIDVVCIFAAYFGGLS